MDLETIDIWCCLLILLFGLLCGILGSYWGKKNSTKEVKDLEHKNERLQGALEECRKNLAAASSPNKTRPTPKPKSKAAAITPTDSFDASAAKAAFGKRVKQDDLKIVEGIGPKIEGLFHSFNIKTWKALSEVSVAKCQEVLDSGGDRYRIHDPASWPMQAKMAYLGQWKKLLKWQDDHRAGKF